MGRYSDHRVLHSDFQNIRDRIDLGNEKSQIERNITQSQTLKDRIVSSPTYDKGTKKMAIREYTRTVRHAHARMKNLRIQSAAERIIPAAIKGGVEGLTGGTGAELGTAVKSGLKSGAL